VLTGKPSSVHRKFDELLPPAQSAGAKGGRVVVRCRRSAVVVAVAVEGGVMQPPRRFSLAVFVGTVVFLGVSFASACLAAAV
jgi:hypothetical protein